MWSDSTLSQLARWGITEDQAAQCGLFYVSNARDIYPDFKAYAAIVIPYYEPSGELMTFERGAARLPFCRVRYLDVPQSASLTKQKPRRYDQPAHSGQHVYFSPLLDWPKILSDPQVPLIITEGEAKGIAGCLAGFPVLALGGVFNFMDNASSETLLPELDAIKWRGRDSFICFDSDASLNPNILAAEARLVDEFQRKRGARCLLVRLPQDGETKVGMDDYLLAHGAAAFTMLLQRAPALGALDAKVVSLNKSCAWIEAEGMIYDSDSQRFISKDNFVNGSQYSSLKHITVGGKQRSEAKEISVAKTWLLHPHARRYGEILFRPGAESVIKSESGKPALNLWTGWEPSDGDITPFLELTDFLFGNMDPRDRDLPLKLMAYKAQNPQVKVPLAIVLIGQQGCGKTLWCETLLGAFAPYSVVCTSSSLLSEFQGWLEKSLLAVINEAKPEDMTRGADTLKALISDEERPMNEKFRPVRQVKTYTLYLITSNRREVGAFSADDRRMIVVNCPPKRTDREFYDRMGKESAWYKAGGPRAVLGWLLNYDLKGWRPPAAAPATAEKHMAYTESLSLVQSLAEQMKTAEEHTIKLWFDQATAWAREAEVSGNVQLAGAARATLDGVNHMQIRPFYEPRELALIFPNLVATLLSSRYDRNTPPGKISRELREAGVPYLVSKDDPRGFMWEGIMRQYLVVRDFDEWTQPISQADFERVMRGAPTYGAMRARGPK